MPASFYDSVTTDVERAAMLLDVEEERDGVRSAIRQARVRVEVNGQTTTLISANYRLPVTVAGVQANFGNALIASARSLCVVSSPE